MSVCNCCGHDHKPGECNNVYCLCDNDDPRDFQLSEDEAKAVNEAFNNHNPPTIKPKKLPSKPNIALFCGVPPTCDRCAEYDAKALVTLPNYGQRNLCESCITGLIESGLNRTK